MKYRMLKTSYVDWAFGGCGDVFLYVFIDNQTS